MARRSSRTPARTSATGSVVETVQRVWGESPFYQARLNGPAPDRLVFQPTDPYAADRAAAEALLRGRLTTDGESLDAEGEPERLWSLASKDGSAIAFLNEFRWLRHLGALGDAGRAPAMRLASVWFEAHERWSPDGWAPAATAERLVNLVCHGALILQGADALWRSRVLASMARQTRHLAQSGHRAAGGFERIQMAGALTVAALCLPGCEPAVERGLELLRRELRLQIRPDGGHVSRNPSRQLAIVVRLNMALSALEARRMEIPGFLRHTVGRAAAYAELFRCGDGRLAVFNGGYEDDAHALASVRAILDSGAEPTGFARHSGFQRLEAGRALLIADVGPPSGTTGAGYLGGASFHFSSGRHRIIGNCGGGAHLGDEWGVALRQAAAHSTVGGEPASLFEPILREAASSHRRAEDARGQLLEIERSFGADERAPRHMRRLFLSANGEDLRGEDQLIRAPAAMAAGWRLRFHLHPAARASVARDGRSVIILLPSGEGWRFRTNAPRMTLEKSVYTGERRQPVSTEQIVLAVGQLEPSATDAKVVKWALKRTDG